MGLRRDVFWSACVSVRWTSRAVPENNTPTPAIGPIIPPGVSLGIGHPTDFIAGFWIRKEAKRNVRTSPSG